MFIFLTAVVLLIFGYIFYGKYIEKVFGASDNIKTPAIKYNDGVDYVPLPLWKIFLIQFLNIAGLGPVFGAVLGAVYGPVCFLWIIFGAIFAGAVHDYTTGMFSVRYRGKTMDFLVKNVFNKHFSLLFSLFLVAILLLVGGVFALNPAKMIADIFNINFIYCIVAIFIYYLLSTFLPIDKIIGRFYPVFSLLLIVVTIALLFCLFKNGVNWFPNPTFTNLHPKNTEIFPLMFITIACGAISGFHATQSPIMARCLPKETDGRKIFYGAMILESFICLVWASLGIVFYHNQELLYNAVTRLGQGGVVAEISKNYLGIIGSKLTILSVVVLSITSGDTAFRAARLTLAETFKINQNSILKRFLLSIFVLSIGIAFCLIDITTLWMYFGWANQTLAMISLWSISAYLKKKGRNYIVTLVPALFMTMVSVTYILHDKIGLNIDLTLSKIIAMIVTALFVIFFSKLIKGKKYQIKNPD